MESGNSDAVIIVINCFIFRSCCKLFRDIVVKSLINK